jgi:L-rhamnonate dehydratase
MKIRSIRAVPVDLAPRPRTPPRVARQATDGFVSPMRRYPELKRTDWSARWKRAACVVTAEDGTWGVGLAANAGPVVQVINDHFASLLAGHSCLAT